MKRSVYNETLKYSVEDKVVRLKLINKVNDKAQSKITLGMVILNFKNAGTNPIIMTIRNKFISRVKTVGICS